ncbi:LOW QUALITY PROTEIN: glucose dehydrogenase [FAD, quinone]-like [Panulirus ornatus]|uniref:LOW QUALITY PROTEIN: glucose dehydrogenase [FAD, quinone]-like n=1 Tax=Panulirus ornatus TaxID=150431 RepID=UPI003A89C5F6
MVVSLGRWVSLFVVPLLRLLLAGVFRQAGHDPYHSTFSIKPYYDFIIVGGGSAGSVLAARLSEVSNWRVLLLEAGGPPPLESYVPGLSLTFYLPSDNSWEYPITPQKHSHKSYIGRSARLLQGRVLGGSSTIGGLLYIRGSKQDYDQWPALGNPGWDYLSVLPYFKKSEDYRGTQQGESEMYHGRGGPMPVSPTSKISTLSKAFLQAGQQLGYSVIDPNGSDQIGFAPSYYTILDGIRRSAAEDFLRPAASRPNLHIVHSATVHKVVMNKNKRAVGVHFMYHGKMMHVMVLREVIMSAGTLSSPKLLMLSGIGAKHHLYQHGVPVVADLPGVGQNLQDHLNVHGLTWTVPSGALNMPDAFVTFKKYLQSRRGIFSEPLGEKTSAWVKVVNTPGREDDNWPDVQCHVITPHMAFDWGLITPETVGLDRSKYFEYYGPILGKEGFTMECHILRPKSRGSVTLRSRDAKDLPVINPNFLSHSDDLTTLISGVKFLLTLGNASALATNLGATFHDKHLPGCERETYSSDAYWGCYIRHMANSYLHPAGTCKMAPADDPSRVVDYRLRVYGVSGLRVVDASIMPVIVSGNTNGPVIMIAEKAADTIKEDWGILKKL